MTIQQHVNLVMNHPTYQGFVSPHITRHLQVAGLNPKRMPSIWKVDKDEQCELRNFLFDEDGYYKDSQEMLDELYPPKQMMPCFQLRDMDIILPDYWIQRDNGRYTIAINQIFQVESVTDCRLPDALAIMVLDCIKARIIRPDDAVKLIMKNQR